MLISQFVDQAKANTKIKVSLKKFSKVKCYQGDAVSLLATLLSTGEQQIPLPTDPLSNNLKIWMTSPKQAARRISSMVLGSGQSDRHILLEPNQEHLFPLHLFADNKGYLFDDPGTYRLRVSVRVEREEWISSNQISFRILTRKTLDPNAISVMYSPSILRFIGLGSTRDPQTLSYVRQIIKKNPFSEISRLLQWTLTRQLTISINKRKTENSFRG